MKDQRLSWIKNLSGLALIGGAIDIAIAAYGPGDLGAYMRVVLVASGIVLVALGYLINETLD